MKISWNHIGRIADLEHINIKEAVEKLTLAGFEVEDVYQIRELNDTIIDISITANRQDIMGWSEVATEILAAIKQPIETKNKINQDIQITPFLYAQNLNLFNRLYIFYINKVPILQSSRKAIEYLKALDRHATSNIMDIINFANLKWNQSIQIYGLTAEKINKDSCFTFQRNDDLGIVNEGTLDIIVNNKNLKHITEINIKHIQNISAVVLVSYEYKAKDAIVRCASANCINAYLEIFSILSEMINEQDKPQLIYRYINKNEIKKIIPIKNQSINRILGPISQGSTKILLGNNTIIKIIKNLNLEGRYTCGQLEVAIPRAREKDIKNTADIAEEVARIYGYNNFYDRLPKFKTKDRETKQMRIVQKIRSILRSIGLNEIITYSLQSRKQENLNCSIINPLNQEQKFLRNNLIEGIISRKIYNKNQANENFEVFEIGIIFNKCKKTGRYKELTHLACLLGNNKFNQSNWHKASNPLTLLQAKGLAEELFERVHAQISWSQEMLDDHHIKNLENYIHPKKRIYIAKMGQIIGVLSKVRPRNKNINPSTYFLEINLSELKKTIRYRANAKYIYSQYSDYPKTSRSLSIRINEAVFMETIESIIHEIKKQYSDKIESIELLSEYWNTKNERTICLKATYRSKHKTLTRKEAEILDNILKTKFESYFRERHKPDSVLEI